MTRNEAMRQTHQLDTLRSLGFTRDESEALRRISLSPYTAGLNTSAMVLFSGMGTMGTGGRSGITRTPGASWDQSQIGNAEPCAD